MLKWYFNDSILSNSSNAINVLTSVNYVVYDTQLYKFHWYLSDIY